MPLHKFVSIKRKRRECDIVFFFRNIVFKPPYKVEEKERTLHFTYLDTMGRTIVTATKNNLVEEHVADFEVHYMANYIVVLL